MDTLLLRRYHLFDYLGSVQIHGGYLAAAGISREQVEDAAT